MELLKRSDTGSRDYIVRAGKLTHHELLELRREIDKMVGDTARTQALIEYAVGRSSRRIGARPIERHNVKGTKAPLVMRSLIVRDATASKANRSVQVIVASENPVERYDPSRDEVIREVLTMAGIQFRTNSRQIPIVDSSDRSTVSNVLGSVRNLRVDGGNLIGDATFASDQRSQETFAKLVDGHLSDFMVNAQTIESSFIARGQSVQTRSGRWEGPLELITLWRPLDASIVTIGLDVMATVL